MSKAFLRMAGFVLGAAISAQSLHAQVLGQGPADPVPVWRVLGALLLCLILAVVGAYVLKTRGNISWLRTPIVQRPSGRLELIESQRLGHQANAWLLRCDRQTVLVVTSPHGTAVHDLAGTAAGAAEAQSGKDEDAPV